MLRISFLPLISILLISYAHSTMALDLFDPRRGAPPPEPVKVEEPPPKPTPVAPKPQPPKPMPPQKDFVLQGTSQIGDKYTAYLQAPDGKTIRQSWKPGQTLTLKGFAGYRLRKVGDKEVEIEYPKESTCRKSDEKKGIKCSKDGLSAQLELRHGQPTAGRPAPPVASAPDATPPNAAPENPVTPKPNIIKPEDVPPGMKIVRTPFGDRLVPIK